MNLTDIQTIYFDSEAIRLQPYKVGRVNIGEGRAYFKYELPVKLYTSLTTVMKTCSPMPYGLWQWWMKHGEKESGRMLKVAANYGTLMHETIGQFCIDPSFDFDSTGVIVDDYLSRIQFYDPDTAEWPQRLQEDMQAWADFVYRHQVKVIAVEMVLCSEAYEYATAIDIVCMMDYTKSIPTPEGTLTAAGKPSKAKFTKVTQRERCIINLKSGRHGFYQENANQLELERMVWNENYPELPVEQVFNWSPTDWRDADGDKYNLKNHTDKINKVEIEAMLMLASERYKGKHERKMHTSIHGTIYYGADPTKNIIQSSFIEGLEKRVKEKLHLL